MGEKPKYNIEASDLDLSESDFSRSKLGLLNIRFEFEKEQEKIKKEQEIKQLTEDLDRFSEKVVNVRLLKSNKICIQENYLNNDLEVILSKYIYDTFDVNFYNKKRVKLESLLGITELNTGSEESKTYIGELRNIFLDEIPSFSENLSNSILSNLTKDKINLNKITKLTIQKGIISIVLENGKEIRNYEIIQSKDQKGFDIKLPPEVINAEKRQEKKESRENETNLRRLSLLGGILTLSFVGEMGLENYQRSQLKEAIFLDQHLKPHKIRLSKQIKSNSEQEFIKNVISQIKEQTGYRLNIDKKGKSFFESKESQEIRVSDMIEIVEKTFNFEDFKKQSPENANISEEKLRQEFEKQKSENIQILRGIEAQEGPLVKPSRFIRRLIILTPKLSPVQHGIMLSLFFREVQKKPGNLESYFKGVGEMTAFNMGAKALVSSLAFVDKNIIGGVGMKLGRLIPGAYGMVTRWLFMTALSVAGGGIGVWAGEHGAEIMKVQQKYDELFPEDEDFVDKTLSKFGIKHNSEELDSVLKPLSGLLLKDGADYLGINIYLPPFPEPIVKHDLDLNVTDKQDYFSGSSRDKKFYNEMVTKMGDNMVDEIGLLIEEFKDPNKLTNKINLNPLTDFEDIKKFTTYTGGGEKAKNLLKKKIRDVIFSGDEETNKEIKETVYKVFLNNLEDIIIGKIEPFELKNLLYVALDKFKIDDDFIESSKIDLDQRKAVYELTFGLVKKADIHENEYSGENHTIAVGFIKKYNDGEPNRIGHKLLKDIKVYLKEYNNGQKIYNISDFAKLDKKVIEQRKKDILLKRIEESILDLTQNFPIKIKDNIKKLVFNNIDNVINGKLRLSELNNYIVQELQVEKTSYNMFKYIQSLKGPEKEFAENYFYRTIKGEEVIQTEKRDTFENANVKNSNDVGYFDVIGAYGAIGEVVKDGYKLLAELTAQKVGEIIDGIPEGNFSKFVDGENSDEAIYERLIKNPLFHQYTLWCKQYKNDLDFIESMKK